MRTRRTRRIAPRVRTREVIGVIGLDLSLRSTAACFIAKDWKGDVNQLKTFKVGEELTKEATPRDHARRRADIANGLSSWVVSLIGRDNAVDVYLEEYAFNKRSSSASGLRELGGVVKDRFYSLGLGFDPIPVTAAAARKTLLGKVPQKGSKEFTQDNVRRLKGEALYWNEDEIDAFVVANHGLLLSGWTPIAFEGKAT